LTTRAGRSAKAHICIRLTLATTLPSFTWTIKYTSLVVRIAILPMNSYILTTSTKSPLSLPLVIPLPKLRWRDWPVPSCPKHGRVMLCWHLGRIIWYWLVGKILVCRWRTEWGMTTSRW
jgi:hypothetical protein